MTKAELEKRILGLEGRIEQLEKENEELRRRTATREAAADEVRNLYAAYLNRCATVHDLTRYKLEEADIHEKIRDEEYERYRGAQTLYCVLFEPHELYQSQFGDQCGNPWINHEIVDSKEMSRRPEWQKALEQYTRSLTELRKEYKKINRQRGIKS